MENLCNRLTKKIEFISKYLPTKEVQLDRVQKETHAFTSTFDFFQKCHRRVAEKRKINFPNKLFYVNRMHIAQEIMLTPNSLQTIKLSSKRITDLNMKGKW